MKKSGILVGSAIVLVAAVAVADTKGAGTKGHVTAYEADGKTVIDVAACPNNKYTEAPCGQTFRDKIDAMLCKSKGKGKHKWKYQAGDGAGKGIQTDQTADCK